MEKYHILTALAVPKSADAPISSGPKPAPNPIPADDLAGEALAS